MITEIKRRQEMKYRDISLHQEITHSKTEVLSLLAFTDCPTFVCVDLISLTLNFFLISLACSYECLFGLFQTEDNYFKRVIT